MIRKSDGIGIVAAVAVPDAALTRIAGFCEERIPPEHRDKLRLEVTTRANSVTIVDGQQRWDGEPGEWMRMRIAQLRYDESTDRWTLHWRDSSDRWHHYDWIDPAATLEQLIEEIDADPTGIFFG